MLDRVLEWCHKFNKNDVRFRSLQDLMAVIRICIRKSEETAFRTGNVIEEGVDPISASAFIKGALMRTDILRQTRSTAPKISNQDADKILKACSNTESVIDFIRALDVANIKFVRPAEVARILRVMVHCNA